MTTLYVHLKDILHRLDYLDFETPSTWYSPWTVFDEVVVDGGEVVDGIAGEVEAPQGRVLTITRSQKGLQHF